MTYHVEKIHHGIAMAASGILRCRCSHAGWRHIPPEGAGGANGPIVPFRGCGAPACSCSLYMPARSAA